MQHTLLKRSEQAVVALLLISALAAVTGYWVFRVWHKRDLVEFDEAPPLEANFRIDINRADWPELMQLPGIGETTARAIVKTREASGPFMNMKDLEVRVRGVGPRMTAEIAPFLLPLHTPTTSRDAGGP